MVKVGDRVKAWIRDEYTPIDGEFGVVRLIDSIGTVHIDFDSGKNLGAVRGVDRVDLVD